MKEQIVRMEKATIRILMAVSECRKVVHKSIVILNVKL
jgi:hypothetical protein